MGATSRTLVKVALGAVTVIVLVQVVTFGIWGLDGNPPDAVVVAAFVLFWGSVIALLAVAVIALRRMLVARRRAL